MCRCSDDNEEAMDQLVRQFERSEDQLIEEARALRRVIESKDELLDELRSEIGLYHEHLEQAKEDLRARMFEVEDLRQACSERGGQIMFYRSALAKIYETIGNILAAPRHPDVIAAKEAL